MVVAHSVGVALLERLSDVVAQDETDTVLEALLEEEAQDDVLGELRGVFDVEGESGEVGVLAALPVGAPEAVGALVDDPQADAAADAEKLAVTVAQPLEAAVFEMLGVLEGHGESLGVLDTVAFIDPVRGAEGVPEVQREESSEADGALVVEAQRVAPAEAE